MKKTPPSQFDAFAALDCFSEIFNSIKESTKSLATLLNEMNAYDSTRIREIHFLSEPPSEKKRMATTAKILFANKFLTFLLGYPPRMQDVATATDESYSKVRRTLDRMEEYFPNYVVYKKVSSDLGLKRSSDKQFAQRKPGKKRDSLDSGRPNRFNVLSEGLLIEKFQLDHEQEEKLLGYLSSPPAVDLMKKFLLTLIPVLLNFTCTKSYSESLHITQEFLIPIWKRSVHIAKKQGSWLSLEMENRLDIVFQEPKAPINIEEKLEAFLKEIQNMPNEDFVATFVVPLLFQPRAKRAELIPDSKNSFIFRCVECDCTSSFQFPLSEPLVCRFCGAEYEKAEQ